MPQTQVHLFAEADGSAPVARWLLRLRGRDAMAFARCVAAVRRLEQYGHELRRPTADYVADGLFELRAWSGRVNYRMLYFFHGRNRAILVHAFTKEAEIPLQELKRASERKRRFEASPDLHTYVGEP